jgi:hypothetical protein
MAMPSVTDRTCIAIAERFKRPKADGTIDAVRAARVRCLTAGHELIRAHFALREQQGNDPTAGELIKAVRKRYTPPRSQEDRYKFFRDYLSISIHRGIFAAID